ncbi:Alpha/Beta hydrolase protein [Schizophyllum commune]
MRSPYVYEGTPTARFLRYISQRGPIGAPLLLLVGGFLAFYVLAKIFSSFLPADAVPDSSCVVDLDYARYEGICEEDTTRFLGVRYAAAPVGNLRWRAPQPPPSSASVIKAVTQPNNCGQGSRGNNPVVPVWAQGRQHVARAPVEDWSEDCLFLNVYAPGKLHPGPRLPVLVWIHGGGYMRGDVASYDGADLMQQAEGGLVIVEIQYRLGVFGFLAGHELQADGTANAGLLDQDFALKWVHEHIAKFGGNPSDVTVWGESAGAGSVLQHLIANDGRTTPPLFKRAIATSTFLPPQYAYGDGIPEGIYNEVLAQTGCSAANDHLRCLRSADANLLLAVNYDMSDNAFYGTFLFVPVVDGSFVRERPSQALSQGKLNARDLLALGITYEGLNFVDPARPESDSAAYIRKIFPKMSTADARRGAEVYSNVGDATERAVAIMGESIFICPGYALMRAFDAPYKGVLAVPPGRHGQDMPYFFPSRNPSSSERFDNAAFQRAFVGSVFDFARTGDPNNKHTASIEDIRPIWPAWSPSTPTEMLFNRTGDEPVVRTTRTPTDVLERCRFWASVSEAAGQ